MSRSPLLVLCLLAAPALAQTVTPIRMRSDLSFTDPFEKAPIPADLIVSGGVAIADVDGDGRGDVLASAALASNATATGFRYYRNRGDGTFEDRSSSHATNGPAGFRRFVLADVDGDGDVDVIGTYALLRNTQGVLVLEQLPSTPSNRVCVAAGDVDGDGDVDLFFGVGFGGGAPRQDLLALNNGAGVFLLAPAGRLPVDTDNTQAARFFDADGDVDLDLVVCIEEESPGTGGARLYRNDGTGTFTAATTGFVVPPQDVLSVLTADFDLDGDRDVVLGTGPDTSGFGRPDLLLRNDGTGQFTAVANALPAVLAATNELAAADLDGDGDADLLLAEGGPAHAQQRVYRNDGTAFTDVTAAWLPAELRRGVGWATGALDGDARPDAVFVSGQIEPSIRTGRVQLFLNRGGTTFLPLNPLRCPGEPWVNNPQAGDGTFADVDGDGDLDWFCATAAFGAFGTFVPVLLRNDGQARLTPASAGLPATPSVVAGRLADVDGDGDPDVLLATANGLAQWRNDGTGSFTVAPAGSMPANVTSVANLCVGDVDGDGDVDLFAGRGSLSTFDELLRNDGTGVFTRDPAALPTHSSAGVKSSVMLDHDGDGDPDLVLALGIGFSTGTITVYRNNGAGQFQLATGVAPQLVVTRLQSFDADGDGDLDLVATTSSGLEFLLDQGSVFAAAQPPGLQTLLASASHPNLFDFEGDGDVDVAVRVFGEWRLLRNDGGFLLREVPGRLLENTVENRFAGADLDGDADADFVVPQVSRDVDVVLGRRVQLHAPWLARVGLPYALELHLVAAFVGRPDSALFALGFARLTPAVPLPPFGMLHVDPSAALLVPGSTLGAPSDEVDAWGLRVSWALPNNPSLLGATLFAQALVLGAQHAGLTNLVADVVH